MSTHTELNKAIQEQWLYWPSYCIYYWSSAPATGQINRGTVLLLYCSVNKKCRWNSVALACISFGPSTLFTSRIPSKRFNNWIGKSIVSIISNGWRKGKNYPRKNLLEIPVDVEDDVVYLLHMKILNLKDPCCLGLSFRKMFCKFREWNGVR